MLALLLTAVLMAAEPAVPIAGQTPSPTERILASRSPLNVSKHRLTGSGAAVLRSATRHADYVLLGEDHGTAEIPAFADALFASLVPVGFDTVVLEVGPLAGARLESWLASRDGIEDYVRFESQFQGATAFYGWRDEFAFLQSARTATRGKLHVWGIDYELMGRGASCWSRCLPTIPGACRGRG